MINLIVGNKGSGKTKALINMVNNAAKTSKGNVVCIEKGLKLTYDIDRSARLIDVEHYNIRSFEAFYGFISGLMAGNYDITDIFVDGTLKVGGRNFEELECMLKKLFAMAEENNTTVTFSLSCDTSELPADLQQYAIEY